MRRQEEPLRFLIATIFCDYVGVTSSGISGRYSRVLLLDIGDRYASSWTTGALSTQTNTPSVASGLYYLSELVEEHTVFAKKLLSRLIFAVISILSFLLVVDGFPILISALSIASHVVYYQNLRRFPIVKLTDPVFITSCGMASLLLGRVSFG
jgi:hypothetical protein